MLNILLATYNGQFYLEEQLESIAKQTYAGWALVISDDLSLDESMNIVSGFKKGSNFKVFVFRKKVKEGAKESFCRLLALNNANYAMFCDQDDIWHKDKVKLTFERMLEEERKSPDTPVLVHSDLRVVDSDGGVIADSFFEYQKLPKKIANLEEALVKNNVTGCTVMLNRAAIDIAMPIPDEAIMHDWWIACKVLQAGGVISFIDRPLIDYRQHESNAVGAHKTTLSTYVRKSFKLKEAYNSYLAVRRQARAMGVEIGLSKFLWVKIRMLFRK